MSSFEVVKKTLDLCEKALSDDLSTAEFDEKVSDGIIKTSSGYTNLTKPMDYRDSFVQTGYAYMYMAAHSNFLLQLLKIARDEIGNDILPGPTAHVAALGGGPGTDILAICQLLASRFQKNAISKLVIDVYEKTEEWEFLREKLVESLEVDFELVVRYFPFDICDQDEWDGLDFSHYALVTSSFFLSELARIQCPGKDDFWTKLVDELPVGALIAVCDWHGPNGSGTADLAIGQSDVIDTIYDSGREDSRLDGSEQKSALGDYNSRFDRSPKLTGNGNGYRLFRKK